jgi:hypothetical protein
MRPVVAERSAEAGNPFGMTELFAEAPVPNAGLRRGSSDLAIYWVPPVDDIDQKHNAAHPGGAVDG